MLYGPDGKPLNPKSDGETKTAPDAQRESNVQTDNADHDVTSAFGGTCPPLTETHCGITYKAQKDWWDKAKPFVEVAGVVLLFVYTVYTIKMYWANKEAADAATSAADTARRTLKVARLGNLWVTGGLNAGVE